MTPSFQPRRSLPAVLLLRAMLACAVLAFTLLAGLAPLPANASANADVLPPYSEVSGYPKYGCYDIAVGGNGMWGGATPYPITVDVPGPVVDAYFVWMGTEDFGAPDAPNQSDLLVNGSISMIGSRTHSVQPGAADEPWYMWRANVGPSGMNLVKQGVNHFTVSGWNLVPDTQHRRNGISLVVVYSTGACTKPNQVDLVDTFEFYWERFTGVTPVMTFTFPPMPVDRDVTVWLHHGGTDVLTTTLAAAAAPEAVIPSACRPMNLWAKTGTGAPPPNLVDYSATPPAPANGGKLVVTNPFVGSTCQSTTWTFPVTGLLGWVDAQGWTRDVGGYIAPQWSIVRVTYRVPANQTFLALQLESGKTGNPDVEQTGESGAWFAQAVIPIEDIKLRIAKTDGVDTAAPGDTLTYTLNYENYGASPSNDVKIVDTLPTGVTFVSASNSGAYNAAANTVTWSLGTLAPGAKGAVTVSVKLDPIYPAGTTVHTNTAVISTSSTGEQDLSDNTATDTTNVVAKAELAISKTGAPEPVEAGSELTYTIPYAVTGNAFSNNTTIVDTLPAGVTFVSASDGGVFANGKVTWSLGNVTPPKSGTLTVVVKVNSPAYNGTILNNSVTISNQAGDTATATAKNTVHAQAELSIAKIGAPEPVDAGSDLTYTIPYTIGGNAFSDNVMIVDTLPANVTFVSASNGGVFADGKVTWGLGNVTPVVTGTLTLVVNVNSPQFNGTPINNSVTITNAAGDTATATARNTVRADHELTISKADDPDPVVKGQQLAYTITWGVTGNEPAQGIVVTDAIPFGTMFVSATGGGVYDNATKTVTWNIGDKVPGDAGVLTLVVTVNADFPNDLDVENTAVITDATPGKEKRDIELTKVVQTPEGSIGDTVWLDSNQNGVQEPGEPGLASVGLILYSAGADGACGGGDDVAVANTVTDANGKYLFDDLAAGVYCVDVIDATVPAGLRLVAGTDPLLVTLAQDQDYLTADFGYASTAGVIGDRVWSDANGNGVQDPGEIGIGGVTLDLMSAGADGQCGTADDAKLASTTTATDGSYLFTGLAAGQYCVVVTDTAGKLTGLTQTKAPTQPITLASAQIFLDADFGYRGATLCGEVGDLVFYDANRNGVFEPGTQDRGINGVTLSLYNADEEALVATTTTDANGAYLFSGLYSGRYWIEVTDVNGRLFGYTLSPGLPNTNNNGQVWPFDVTIDGCTSIRYADFGYADGHLLVIAKTNNLPSGQPVEAGAELIWTMGYSVNGRGTAPNVVITDQLPMQVDFLSASNGGTYDAATRTVTWHLGNLEPGASGTVTLTVRVHKPLDNNSYIFNTAIITDDARLRDQASDIVRVHAAPILNVTKTNEPTGEVEPGDTITYKVCATNTGNGTALNAKMTDVIPVNTTYVPGSATGDATFNEATMTLTWTRPVLGLDQPWCGTFQVKVNMIITGLTGQANVALSFSEWNALSIDNTVILTADGQAPKTASVSNPLNATVDPIIFKTANKTQVHQGDPVVFTVSVRNEGNATATNVVVTDLVPTRLDAVTVAASKGTVVYDPVTRLVTLTIGQLSPNEVVTLTISGKAAYVQASETPYELNNEAVVSFTEGAPRTSNRVTVTVVYFLPGEIPEPGTWLMLGTGLAGLAGYARARVQSRRRKQQR